ncbi:hypothetical protein OPT61_g4487 [Boeremia exigua]|uniref:Uncharacterized protein n=1 Tax=Boeremia exigua TaxID=749465 RepID=A0ACC2IE33_9PLEO|nr:hypothetical protein OPT61_g4487 [Boeremia exigua]
MLLETPVEMFEIRTATIALVKVMMKKAGHQWLASAPLPIGRPHGKGRPAEQPRKRRTLRPMTNNLSTHQRCLDKLTSVVVKEVDRQGFCQRSNVDPATDSGAADGYL